jgi:hypothetical protein
MHVSAPPRAPNRLAALEGVGLNWGPPLQQGHARQHGLGRLVYSRLRPTRLLRLLLIALLVGLGLVHLNALLATLAPPQVYSKDFLHDYLLATAIASQTAPYLPVEVLASDHLNVVLDPPPGRPSPHPPPVGVLFLPTILLEYPTAATLWFGLGIVFLTGSIYLLARTAGSRPTIWVVLAVTAAAMAWYPVWEELAWGQLMLALLFLVAAARLAVLSGRAVLGGILLGFAALIKPVVWPLILLFVFRKHWRVVGASTSTILLGYAVASWVIGPDELVAYFTQALPAATEAHKAASQNLSVRSIGWRLFEGTETIQARGIVSPPLIESAPAALVLSAALPLLVLLTTWLVVKKERGIDMPFGVTLSASILISPIAWAHYLVLAAIPAAQVLDWLVRHRFPARQTNLMLAVAALLAFPAWSELARLVAGQPLQARAALLGPGPALLTLGPLVGVAALAWLLVSLKQDEQAL